MKPTFFKGVVLGAVTCFVLLAGASALAGTGVGDVFNLGETNVVDAPSTLQGNVSANPQLQLLNTGSAAALRADGIGGRGVFGRHRSPSGVDPGVEGETSSTTAGAAGVLGRVPGSAGLDTAAVRGINPSTQAQRYGVWGSVQGSGYGVFGQATGGAGVSGEGTSGTGVLGTATTGTAVRGLSQSGRGVQGQNLSATRSVNGDQAGVYGVAGGDDGGQFVSNKGNGVCAAAGLSCAGLATLGSGLVAMSANGYGASASSLSKPPLQLIGPANQPPVELNSAMKVANLNADLVDSLDSTQLVTRARIYRRSSGLTTGTPAGGGTCSGGDTCIVNQGCDSSGDLLLSGGYWGIDGGTTVMANRPLITDQWQSIVVNNSTVDSFMVDVWCADMTP